MIKIGDYEKIMSDRNLFNQVIYTPLSDALRLLDERSKDADLVLKVKKLLDNDIPEVFKDNKKYAVLFRQVATPNYETKRFIALAKENNLHPIIFEYHDDIFSPDNNEFKYSLGKLPIHKTIKDKPALDLKEYINIVDFNLHKGKKIREVLTIWSEPLIDFHKLLFNDHFKNEIITVWNASDWYKNKGATARDYYKFFFLFFIYHGILFENFLSSKDTEGDFTKNIVLPAIEEVMNMTGVKPLIVPIEPIDSELDEYWVYHSPNVRQFINDYIKNKK